MSLYYQVSSRTNQDFTSVSSVGWNIIHWIVSRLNADDHCVDYLEIIQGSTSNMSYLINQSSNVGNTSLHEAAYVNNHKAIEWLLHNNANITVRNNSGQRPGEHTRCDNETKELLAQCISY